MYEITSEIYTEMDVQLVKSATSNGKVVSRFEFHVPENLESLSCKAIEDKDGDLLVSRRRPAVVPAAIEIEHFTATVLRLVGLQVWRGALLLADFLFSKRSEMREKVVLELGAGVGLTSIAAAMYASKVICTDVDMGGILDLIRANVQRNRKVRPLCEIEVLECDFKMEFEDYPNDLRCAFDESDVIVAADVIYDDELTDAFIHVVDSLFERDGASVGKRKDVYVALEKRYVFTLTELDAVAPMFEYFLKQIEPKSWYLEYIPIDFPQYFVYERCKELVLLKLSKNRI